MTSTSRLFSWLMTSALACSGCSSSPDGYPTEDSDDEGTGDDGDGGTDDGAADSDPDSGGAEGSETAGDSAEAGDSDSGGAEDGSADTGESDSGGDSDGADTEDSGESDGDDESGGGETEDDGDGSSEDAGDSDESSGEDSSGSDDGGTDDPPGTTGCNGAQLLENPEEFTAPGPWPVGARTVTIGRLTVEVWYPAERGSEAGIDPLVYDVRLALPAADQAKIPDEDNPWQDCDCYSELPLDGGHGPYPVVIFIHGTAGFRTQSLQQMEHWASRGFVVLAADHPGLWLADQLTFSGVRDLQGDLDAMVAAIQSPTGELAFLEGHVDAELLGMAGHSAGGGAVQGRGAEAAVIMPLASGGVTAGAALQSSLIMGGQRDGVAAYSGQVSGYGTSPARKRLVGVENGGHLVFSDLCGLTNDEGQDLVEIATEYNVTNVGLATLLWDGCEDDYIEPPVGWEIVNHATAAVLEETLHCREIPPNLADIAGTHDLVGEYQEEL